MKVEEACRLSADGVARFKEAYVTEYGDIREFWIYAKFNEIKGRYEVTQICNNRKIPTAKKFQDPHQFTRWKPSQRFSKENRKPKVKSEYCLYLLVSKDRYEFTIGLTNNIYTRVYQLRLMWGEFDLEASSIVYGEKHRLEQLEKILYFAFEEYKHSNSEVKNDWFEMDCYWYAKNEIRRLNSFREEKIFRIFEGVDLNAFIVEEVNKLGEDDGFDTKTENSSKGID